MQTLQQALNHALAAKDVAAVRALTNLINEINAELKESGVCLTNYISVDTGAAFHYCLQECPDCVESLFCWRDVPPAVVVDALRAAAQAGDSARMKIIANTVKQLDPKMMASIQTDAAGLKILGSLGAAFEFQQWITQLQQKSLFIQADIPKLVSLVEQEPALLINHIHLIKTAGLNKKHWDYIQSQLQKNEKLRLALPNDLLMELTQYFNQQEAQAKSPAKGAGGGGSSSSSTSQEPAVSSSSKMSAEELMTEYLEKNEPISVDGQRRINYMREIISTTGQPVTFTSLIPEEMRLFIYPETHLGNSKPSLKWLMNLALNNGDVTKYKKYFLMNEQVELRLAKLGLTNFNLEQIFAENLTSDDSAVSESDVMQQLQKLLLPARDPDQKLLFLASQHPEYLALLGSDNRTYRAVLNKVFHLMEPAEFQMFIERFIIAKLQNNRKQDLVELLSEKWPYYVKVPLNTFTNSEKYNERNTNKNLVGFMQAIVNNTVFERRQLVNIANKVYNNTKRRSTYSSNAILAAHQGFIDGIEQYRRNLILTLGFRNPIQEEDRHLTIDAPSYDIPVEITARRYYFTEHFNDPTLLGTFERYLDNSQRIILSMKCRDDVKSCLQFFKQNSQLIPFTPEQINRFVIAEHLNTILYFLTARITLETSKQIKAIITDCFNRIVEYEAGMQAPSIMQAFLARLHERMAPVDKNQTPLQVNQSHVKALEEGYTDAVRHFAKNNAEKLRLAGKYPSEKDQSSSNSASSTKGEKPVATSSVSEKSSSSTNADFVYPPAAESPVATAATVGMYKVRTQSTVDVRNASTSSTPSAQVAPPAYDPSAEPRPPADDLQRLADLPVADDDLDELTDLPVADDDLEDDDEKQAPPMPAK